MCEIFEFITGHDKSIQIDFFVISIKMVCWKRISHLLHSYRFFHALYLPFLSITSRLCQCENSDGVTLFILQHDFLYTFHRASTLKTQKLVMKSCQFLTKNYEKLCYFDLKLCSNYAIKPKIFTNILNI